MCKGTTLARVNWSTAAVNWGFPCLGRTDSRIGLMFDDVCVLANSFIRNKMGVKLEGYMEMIFLFTPTWCTVYYCLGISTPRLGKTTIWDKIKLLYTWLSGVPGTYGTKTLAYLWFQMGALGSVGRKQIIAPSSRQGWKLSGNQPTSEVSRSQF